MRLSLTVPMVIALIVVMLGLTSCQTGEIYNRETVLPDGTTTRESRVKQSPKAVSPGTLMSSWGKAAKSASSGMSASTGAPAETDQALSQLAPLTWAGIALCVVGVGLFVARIWVPLIPMLAAWAALGLGAAFLVLPMFLDRFLWLIALCGALVALGAILWLGVKLRWFHLATSPEAQQERLKDNDPRSAGTLAYLASQGDRLRAKAVAKLGLSAPVTAAPGPPSSPSSTS